MAPNGASLMYTVPAVLTLLAAAVLVVGLRQARRFRRPGRFRAGVIATAFGLVCVWALPAAVLIAMDRQDYEMLLLIAALFVAASLLGAGINAMSRANNTPRDEIRDPFWDNLP